MGSEVSRVQSNGENNKKISSVGNEVNSKKMSRRMSMGTTAGKSTELQTTPSIRVGGSTGMLTVNDNDNEINGQQISQQSSRLSLSIDPIVPRSRSGSSSSQSPTKPSKKCSISLKNIQLIQSCFNNPHENIGFRILKRSAERRKDFGRFYSTVTIEQREQIADTIKCLLKNSVNCLGSPDEKLHSLAIEFGQRFVCFRVQGFKADYFASLADSTITECLLLDAAVHPAALTLNAFSQFITMLFSELRNGFYMEMRRLRRASNSFSTISNGSGSRKKLSVDDAIKAAASANSSLLANGASNVRRSSTTKEIEGGGGSYSRRGSGGSTSNNSVNAASSRSVSPADECTFVNRGGSSQDEDDNNKNNKIIINENIRRSHSPSPNRKISSKDIASLINSEKEKEEQHRMTAAVVQ